MIAMANEPIPEKIFKILACPVCKKDLIYNGDKSGLVCKSCKADYPIKEGIPILLPPEMQE